MASETWTAIGAVAAVVGVVIVPWSTLVVWFANQYGKEADCSRQYRRYADSLCFGRWDRYRQALIRLLDGIDRFFGFGTGKGVTRLFLKPWTRCFQLAFVYPITFYLIVYSSGLRIDLATLEILEPAVPLWRRFALSLWIVGCGLFFFLVMRFEWFERGVCWVMQKRLWHRVYMSNSYLGIWYYISIILLFLLHFYISFLLSENFSLTLTFYLSLIIPVTGIIYSSVIMSLSLSMFLIFILYFITKGNIVFPVTVLSFYALFPLVNSLVDWGSVSATRWLMGRWVSADGSAAHHFLRYVLGTCLDLGIVIVCICLLSALLAAEMAGLNVFLSWVGDGQAFQLDWLGTMRAFRDDPWGEGLFVTLMVFSTLLPTVIHLTAGSVGALVMPNLGRDYVMRKLVGGPPAPTDRMLAACVTVSVRVIPLFVWLVLAGLFLRFFVPLSWLEGIIDVPPEGGYLLTWLPYVTAEWVWIALGQPT